MHLLTRIERYLRRSGTKASALGRELMNDPGFIRQLRNGREPTPKTAERICAWLDSAERPRRDGK